MAYKICIYNEGTETIIHYPAAEKSYPHLSKMDLDEKQNDIDSFKFSISCENQGYNLLSEFRTKIKIIDVNDNSIRFTGRIINITENMDESGFYKDVEAECALAYLVDSNSRGQALIYSNLTDALTALLNKHNASVEDDKKIYLGNITLSTPIAYQCNYDMTLATILNMLSGKDYYIQVRESNSLLYLDVLTNIDYPTVDVRMGENMKKLVKSKGISNLATRIIPLGANNLDISSVNGGIDYIEDENAKNLYGVIEKTVSYSDITDAATLKSTALADMHNYTQPLLTLEINALDLSKLTGIKANEFKKNMNIHIVNPVMAIDTTLKIVECDVDLTKEYNPKLTLSNIPQTMQEIMSGLQNSSLQTDSTHNGVQVGDDFGIRVDSSLATLTLNATDGISMLNKLRNLKVFYVDTDGNLVLDGKQQVTADGKVLIQNFKNENGGLMQIFNIDGDLDVGIGSNGVGGQNEGGTIILYDKGKPRVAITTIKDGGGVIYLYDGNGNPTIKLNADYGGAGIVVNGGQSNSIILSAFGNNPAEMLLNGQYIATQDWVTQYFQQKSS